MLMPEMKSLINALWDKFWSGGISNPLTAIEQISYLLFMRRLDEMDTKLVNDAEFTGDNYNSIFKGKFKLPSGETIDKKTLRWSHFKQMEGGEMLRHVQINVFPFIKQLNGSNTTFTKHMEDAVFIIPKASLLVEAVIIIDRLYDEIEKQMQSGQIFHDTQGDMYEFLLSEIATSGKNGQFRTPRHIIALMCELVDPRIPDLVCDPACGTSGFLLGAYQHILTQHTSKENLFIDENGFTRGSLGDKLTDKKLWKHLKETTFYGYDFDSTMVRIGLMNMILHGITNPNIKRKDTLSKKYNEDNKYNCIFANPPFKGSIDKGDINETLSLATTKTELLFVNRIINSLRIGGRAAVIVPDGVLFGSSNAHKDLRKMLIEKCELQGVVSMPSGVFKPYAGVSTAIIVFVKGGTTEKVWFYDMQTDGFSLDDKREKIEANDLPDIVKNWKVRNKSKSDNRTAKHFFVPVKEIIDNGFDLSINRYKETIYITTEYEKPKVILGKIEAIEKEIMDGIKELKKIM